MHWFADCASERPVHNKISKQMNLKEKREDEGFLFAMTSIKIFHKQIQFSIQIKKSAWMFFQ